MWRSLQESGNGPGGGLRDRKHNSLSESAGLGLKPGSWIRSRILSRGRMLIPELDTVSRARLWLRSRILERASAAGLRGIAVWVWFCSSARPTEVLWLLIPFSHSSTVLRRSARETCRSSEDYCETCGKSLCTTHVNTWACAHVKTWTCEHVNTWTCEHVNTSTRKNGNVPSNAWKSRRFFLASWWNTSGHNGTQET